MSILQYKGWDAEKAIKDYYTRIREQEAFYEPIIDPDVAWIKVINVGERIIINRIEGYLQSRIIFFLMVSPFPPPLPPLGIRSADKPSRLDPP